MPYRIVGFALVLAAIAMVFLLVPKGGPAPGWIIDATYPIVVGGYGDNFSYSGADVRPLTGTLSLRFDPIRHDGTIAGSVKTTAKSGGLRLSSAEAVTGEIELYSRIEPDTPIITDADIYGDTGIRGPVLPKTHAYLAGKSSFSLYVNGKRVDEKLEGEWALVQAVRKEDGAVRKSGLVYSPLLRDKTGFADPKKTQFILIVYSSAPDPNNDPPYALVLHLVFTAVKIEKSPQQG